MHLPDGVVAGHVSILGYAASFSLAVLTSYRRKLAQELTKISLVAAVLFVASIITIPLGYTTVHFSFLGLAGVVLGARAFVAVVIAVFLQLILFKHGGFSTLGINIFNLGTGALAGWLAYKYMGKIPFLRGITKRNLMLRGGLAGALAGITKVGLGATTLYYSGYPLSVAATLFSLHLPVFVIEGLGTAFLAAAFYKHGILCDQREKLQ